MIYLKTTEWVGFVTTVVPLIKIAADNPFVLFIHGGKSEAVSRAFFESFLQQQQ